MSPELEIGGFAPFSSVDWPGMLTATVFTRGCPWNCPYCHNPHLIAGGEGAGSMAAGSADGEAGGADETTERVEWAEVRRVLESRAGVLDGVVFTGGEPTAQPGLAEAIDEVRALGLKVGLHTNGAWPERFAALLPRLDWVGLDVKAPFDDYDRITGVAGSGTLALTSLRAAVASGVDLEVRTTVHSDLLAEEDLRALARALAREGVRVWAVQAFQVRGARPGLGQSRFPDAEAWRRIAGDAFDRFVIRD